MPGFLIPSWFKTFVTFENPLIPHITLIVNGLSAQIVLWGLIKKSCRGDRLNSLKNQVVE